MERLADRVQVGKGKVLVREGQVGKEVFLILSGAVGVTQKDRRVNTLGPGDFFGELAALNRGLRNATVTALSDVDMLIMGPREFHTMTEIPEFRAELFKRMASKMRTIDAQLVEALDRERPSDKCDTLSLAAGWPRHRLPRGRQGAPDAAHEGLGPC